MNDKMMNTANPLSWLLRLALVLATLRLMWPGMMMGNDFSLAMKCLHLPGMAMVAGIGYVIASRGSLQRREARLLGTTRAIGWYVIVLCAGVWSLQLAERVGCLAIGHGGVGSDCGGLVAASLFLLTLGPAILGPVIASVRGRHPHPAM